MREVRRFESEGRVPDADWPRWRHRKAAEIYPGRAPSSPGYFENFNGALYFSADDGVHGRELWRTSHAMLQQDQATTELVKVRRRTTGGLLRLLGLLGLRLLRLLAFSNRNTPRTFSPEAVAVIHSG